MHQLEEESISCPYCGEVIGVLIDPEDTDQEYIEDCQVCCRPISFYVFVQANGELTVTVRAETSRELICLN